MKHFAVFTLLIAFTISLTGCPSDDKSSNVVATAPGPASPPDRGGCKWDPAINNFRFDDGTTCSHGDYYDANACYNFYYDIRWNRYYDVNGNPVECNNEYVNYSTVIPYNHYNFTQGYAYTGCPAGFLQIPVGYGFYVCATAPADGTGNLNMTWLYWLNQ